MYKILLCVGTKHDWRLVAAAAVVCALGAAATMFLVSRAPLFPRWRRLGWLAMTGLVTGTTTFTTHFVAMLAFKSGMPTAFAPLETGVSLAVAVAGSVLALTLADARGQPSQRRSALAGALLGAVIAAMHYLGMAGVRLEGHLIWSPVYVAASLAWAAACGAVALVLARRDASPWRIVAASAALTLAIAGLHFTGMTAVSVVPDPRVTAPTRTISDALMAAIAIAAAALIMAVAVAGAVLDAFARFGALRRLQDALDALSDGVAFYDPLDRLVAWNAPFAALRERQGLKLQPGLGYEELLSRTLAVGAFPDVVGRETDWLRERRALRETGGSRVVRASGGAWLRITDRRTDDGGTITSCVDVTELKRAEAELIEARDEARELARRAETADALAGVGHWRLDAETQAMDWSPELYRIYGFEPGATLDFAAVNEMSHPDDRQVAEARLTRQLQGAAAEETFVSRVIDTAGELRYLLCNTRAEFGVDGKVAAVIGTVVDVTDEKLAELALSKSEARFRRLAANAPAIIAETQLDGKMTYASPASLAMTGYAPEELVGKRFDFWMAPDDAKAIAAMCRTVLASDGKVAPWPVAFRARRKSGEPLWMECSPTPVLDPQSGEVIGFSDVVRDITPRKQLEAQMLAARSEAEAAAMVKAEFLANMSHELRTPLTSIIGFTGLAADLPGVPPLASDYIGRVREASQALLCTVNDILDFSKLEAGQVAIHPAPVNLAALCETTLNLFAPQAGAKDLRLVFEGADVGGRMLLLDADRIRQVLLNFIGNAVKFTNAGDVTLGARYDETSAALTVDVIDTGPGIAADKQSSLFKRFSQIDGSTSRAAGGTGLGLAICKGLIEAMGGTVGLESDEGDGARFWFNVPAPAVELTAANVDDGAASAIASEGLRVLVVDDHPANRDLARLYLASVGADVAEAADGTEALQLAGGTPFDVILLDLRMPGLDGVQVLRRLRAQPGPNDLTPVLAYTADAGEGAFATLHAQGFDGVVGKPVEPATLIQAVARAASFETAAQSDAA